MSTAQIADRLTELCKKGDWQTAYDELYDEKAKSIEPFPSPIAGIETSGLQAIRDKAKKFDELIEQIFSIEVSASHVIGNYISFALSMDAAMIGRGRAMILSEICLYKVQQGKIVSEQFFYN
jgi:hypothetical protein